MDREKVILAVCIGTVLFYTTLQMVVRPLQDRTREVSGQIISMERSLKKDRLIIRKATKSASREAYYRDTFRQTGTDEESVSKIISEIEKIATDVDLRISELKPAAMKHQEHFNTFSVRLVFDAPFEKIAAFLEALQGAPYYFSIDELDIVKPMGTNSTELRVSLSLSRLLIPLVQSHARNGMEKKAGQPQ
ncbi:MAG: type 4a pilus biogenesis protein PilO [Candidatus Omnitrophica bacterium]|nr:type 4a pilus biogenesis protein PilO [Candidatus Omnitrophota bacterium]